VEYVSETPQNPFGTDPQCERYVPGYGDVSADFHVVGDHSPGSRRPRDGRPVHWPPPVEQPAEWTQGDVDRLVHELARLRRSDYRRVSDLCRFLPDDPSLVR
jgi:hypothetical protein